MKGLTVTAVVLVLAGCGGGGGGAGDAVGTLDPGAETPVEPVPESSVVVPLLTPDGDLELGTATFGPVEGEPRTSVVIQFPYSAEPGQTAQIVEGTCEMPGAAAHELEPLDAGTSTTVIETTVEALEQGPPLAVHVLAPDGVVAACGAVEPGQAAGG